MPPSKESRGTSWANPSNKNEQQINSRIILTSCDTTTHLSAGALIKNSNYFPTFRGIYFAGHSAGAHLVAKLLSGADFLERTPGSRRLQAAFLISGVYDLREIVHTYVNDAVRLPEEWAVAMSPLFDDYKHLFERKIRMYILAGEHDSGTFKRQSREFYEHLLDVCRTQHMYFEIKDRLDHFDIVENFANQDNFLKNLVVHDVRKHL
ncbi:Kynurenine formamidase [Eumeta japonica]|uniref:Kynurenine formamidase n=1 Tax=Eumeta variegata TaxID=151549 RepID=A0A4C1YWU0_EUMVA|nr:Kynurenine formamidase [Eumeta japonica]